MPSLTRPTGFRMRLVTTFYRRTTLMVRDLSRLEYIAPSVPARIATLSPADVDSYMDFRPRTDRRAIEARLARGDQAVVAWAGDRIVHAAWVATGRAHVAYLRRDLLLAPDELLVYDSFTLPAFRGSGIARARMAYVFREYGRRGFRRCFAVVAAENEVGSLAMQSGGYRPTGGYSCIRLGVWHWCWRSAPAGARVPALAR